MKTLIIGNGEIGKALYKILKKEYPTVIIDKKHKDELSLKVEIMHICFPFSDKFIRQVLDYKEIFKPNFTVIHSTVPVGTSNECNAIHSPVIGKHPNLKKSLLTFTKFIGGDYAGFIANYFSKVGIKSYITDNSESTELMKLMSTLFFGLMVEFTKEVKYQCIRKDVPFELFTLWNDNYNKGYKKLGYPEFKKPLLIPQMEKIGGHCVLSNTKLINSVFADFVSKLNGE